MRITILVEIPEGRRRLGRPRRGWEFNIKMNVEEMWREGMDLVDLPQDRDRWHALLGTAMNLPIL
jgi:hypothetical protein